MVALKKRGRLERGQRGAVDRCRAGMTLVELSCVILIIATLISILLPALQSARSSARKVSCAKNLGQLILAVKLYQGAHDYFPPGVIDDGPEPIQTQAQGVHHSWISQILPYLKEMTTYRKIDFRYGVYHPRQRVARTSVLAPLQCPSLGGVVAVSHYAAVHNDIEEPISSANNGPFYLNSALRPQDIEDGLGYTLFLGEMIPYPGSLGWMSGTRATLRNLGERLGLTATNGRGLPWATSGQKMPPELTPKPLDVGGFGSLHKGITLFTLGDGRVHSVSNFTDQRVLRQLANRRDGAPLNASFLRSWDR